MKLILQIAAGVLLAGLIGWAVISHEASEPKPGARADEILQQTHDAQQQIEDFKREHPAPTVKPDPKPKRKAAKKDWTCRVPDQSQCQ
jgi:hypothetical protein